MCSDLSVRNKPNGIQQKTNYRINQLYFVFARANLATLYKATAIAIEFEFGFEFEFAIEFESLAAIAIEFDFEFPLWTELDRKLDRIQKI